METSIENNSEESDIANVFPANGQWTTNNPNNASNSTLLFIAVEYVGKEGTNEYKFEPDANFSPQASTYSEFDQHVSPLDPNMSSAARYSPVYSDSVDNGYNNSVVVLQDGVNPLISTEICQNTEYVNNGNANYNHLSPTSPLDSSLSSLSTSDTNILRQVVANPYLQMGSLVTTSNGDTIVDDASCTPNGSPVVDFNQSSPEDGQIIDKELQLVQFPVDGYNNLSMERNLKVDPEQVELLITDQNTGVSYSGYISQDFLVSRSSLPALTEDEQHLNQVLNTFETHGLVMDGKQEINDHVNAQNGTLSISEGQMMLQDTLLDSDLLLQAPVEIALDDTVLANNALALKNSTVPILPTASMDNSQTIDEVSLEGVPNDLVICDEPNSQHNNIKMENYEIDELELRRSKRKKCDFEEDTNLLNNVQTISDKPVPSRARATLPAIYLVINKLPNTTDTNSEFGVFARKLIPKRTQFGPLEGILTENIKTEDIFQLLVETETGAMQKLDISDENTSNWMRFVRPAKNYSEMNLVLSQQGYSLYYTTTRAILPRQELLVGYSAVYAAKRNFPALQPNPHEELPWHCYECPMKFLTSEEFQKHLNVHDDVKDENEKPRVRKLNRIRRRFSMACPYCTRTFFKKYSLNRHLLSHTNPASYNKEIQVKPMRKIVKNTPTDKNLQWKCTICKLIFSNPSLHNIHELVHKDSTTNSGITGLPLDVGSNCHEGEYLLQSGLVQCPECGNEFESHTDLISHVTEHGQKYQENQTQEVRKAFKCPLCYKSFALRERLQRHMLVHGSDDSKPLKCDTCGKRFLNNSALTCHLKTHKWGSKIFECPICKENFDQVFLLKEHVRTHSVNGNYTCPHCNKIFKEYCVIRKHIRAFHCDRKHGCPYCSKPFPTLDKLRMHLLKHSDHREFLCADCGKQFKRKDKLKEHMKRMHGADREPKYPILKNINNNSKQNSSKKSFSPKVQPTDYHRFIYKCHTCLLGFKRRGMLVNHLAKRHPDVRPESVPELNLPILKTTRDYYCQYCDKIYKSSSKRKAHILKNHPGLELPMSNRRKGGLPEVPGEPNPTFSQTVGSVTTSPHACPWCHKQYASKAKLLQHQRKKHSELMPKVEKRTKSQQKLPASPSIPEDSKYIQSPDVPDDLGALGASGIMNENEITEDQFNAISTGNYIQCDGNNTKVIFDSGSKYKLQDDNLLNGQVFRIIELDSNQLTINSENIQEPTESSRLYRLLTSNGPFPPYPPR